MNCPGCYRPLRGGKLRFCPACAKLLFDGQTVSPQLAFTATELPGVMREDLIRAIKRISISGVQFKVSMRLEGAALVLSAERGTHEYILKPPPRSFDIGKAELLPANEHFTMQLARQVFGLRVAPCALLQFADEQPAAYLTRRFDVQPTGEHLLQEDFAQLAGRSRATHGDNFKYEFSYEGVALLMRRFVLAAQPDVDEFFRLTLFNYLVSNGDAHLKNFSLHRRPETGEYHLTPAYDLLNTRLHVNDGNGLALDLFADEYETPSFQANAYLAYDDFRELGHRLGLPARRVQRLLVEITGQEAATENLLARSFLPIAQQEEYAASIAGRRQRLRYSLSGSH